MSLASSLEGLVALITNGGEGIGRAIALLLSSRGARVVVVGVKERALGEVVGEVANAGGRARHLAGDPTDPKVFASAVARAVDVFGGLDVVVVDAGGAPVDATLSLARVAAGTMTRGRLVVVVSDPEAAGAAGLTDLGRAIALRGVACHVVPSRAASEPEAVAELVATACAS